MSGTEADSFGTRLDRFYAEANATHGGPLMALKVARWHGWSGRNTDLLGAAFHLVQREITFADVCRKCS